jgi:hypothetical protein
METILPPKFVMHTSIPFAFFIEYREVCLPLMVAENFSGLRPEAVWLTFLSIAQDVRANAIALALKMMLLKFLICCFVMLLRS